MEIARRAAATARLNDAYFLPDHSPPHSDGNLSFAFVSDFRNHTSSSSR